MGKTSRIYHYHVNIVFKGTGVSHKIGRVSSGYAGSINYQDTFVFFTKSCNIVMSRTKNYADGTILSNASNTINSQIVKALLCYYALATDFPVVDRISIIRKQSGRPDYVYKECSTVSQPILGGALRSSMCNSVVIKGLMEDSQRGLAMRNAMSYWLKGIASNDAYYRFEHIWRAFNGLFMFHGNHPKEFECMRTMRQLILDNAGSFSRSISITNGYTKDELHAFRWVRMILNDYETRAKNQALVDFVCRYHDGRIMEMLGEKLACRRKFLKEDPNKLDVVVDNHINSNTGTRNDVELVTLLSIKYSYFVRNKIFHGEIADGTFKLMPNNIDHEITCLNNLLETLVLELMDNYHLLRNA